MLKTAGVLLLIAGLLVLVLMTAAACDGTPGAMQQVYGGSDPSDFEPQYEEPYDPGYYDSQDQGHDDQYDPGYEEQYDPSYDQYDYEQESCF